jgi:hypothetical protein
VLIMEPPIETSRPSKFTHAQTILYEIEMLKFAAGDFEERTSWASWRNLECFLLHFRNLIEFFGKPQPRGNDLTIQRPDAIWPDSTTRPSAEVLNRLHREDLWAKYEGQGVNDKISRYLQHCTEQRVEDKNWRVREMFQELEPLMSEFENALPDKRRPWQSPANPQARVIAMQETYSTASPRRIAVLSLQPDSSTVKKKE